MRDLGLLHDPSFSSSTSRDYLPNASPQAISGRTSYGRARLEFLLYAQVIPACCTARGCGPPPDVTRGSPCSCVARSASGLIHATYFACYNSLSLRIRTIKCLFLPHRINSLARSAKSTQSPRTARKFQTLQSNKIPNVWHFGFLDIWIFPCYARLLLYVSILFQFSFTPLTGVLFTFPSRYWFAIDLKRYLALEV